MSNETYDKVIQLFKDIGSIYPGQPMTKHEAKDFDADLNDIALDYGIECEDLYDFVDWLERHDVDEIEDAYYEDNEVIVKLFEQLDEPNKDFDL